MRKLLSLALLGALSASIAHAENFTEINTDKAKAIIDAAITAHGGDALLDELQTLIIETHTVNHSVDQSRGTDAPWDTSVADSTDALDLENSIFMTSNKGSGGGFENHNTTIINGEQSYQLNLRAGTVAKIAEPDFDTTSGPFVRVTPALLLRTLKDREANAHYLGDTRIDDVDYNVIGFSMTVGPAISLYFEKGTNFLRRSERVFPGFGLVEYRFDDYVVKGEVPYNESFTLYLNGDVNLERSIKSVRINEPMDKLLEVPAALVSIPEVQPDPLTRQELDDGVWLIGGNGTYAMFVDMGEYIFAAGGTAGIPDRIESLREVVGEKPIRYGMLTHHHFDHVLGVAAYEEEGATIIAAESHERIARRAATDGENLDLKLVNKKMTLEANGREIEVIDIGPTAHTEHLLVAWLPQEGILFEADHFAMPRVGPVPPAVTSTKTFAKALARNGLSVKQIVSAHSPKPGTAESLEKALSREEFQASR
ncbi:MAG: MBL fold metallo-hydrolase [Gammaproteobacteria bacterium]|nr:MBL fold metallo-hydrolase [Gammaproteobacteria bacterium]